MGQADKLVLKQSREIKHSYRVTFSY